MLLKEIQAHIETIQTLIHMEDSIEKAANMIIQAIASGNKILVCGNGGSAADAQHFAAELVGRFKKERKALPAFTLTTDTSILTSIGNDYGFEFVFSRQIESLGVSGDIFIGISTSGNSANIIKAVEAAEKFKIATIGLLGKNGGALASIVELPLIVQAQDTARIQEAHIFILHCLAGMIEDKLLRTEL